MKGVGRLSFARRKLPSLAFVCMVALALSGCGPSPYNADADPWVDLDSALEISRSEGKQVLVVFGANWCGSCLWLEDQFAEERLSASLNRDFVQMKVDVGDFDRNLDFVNAFGDPIAGGIPAVAVVGPKRTIEHIAMGDELAHASSGSSAKLAAWFKGLADAARARQRSG